MHKCTHNRHVSITWRHTRTPAWIPPANLRPSRRSLRGVACNSVSRRYATRVLFWSATHLFIRHFRSTYLRWSPDHMPIPSAVIRALPIFHFTISAANVAGWRFRPSLCNQLHYSHDNVSIRQLATLCLIRSIRCLENTDCFFLNISTFDQSFLVSSLFLLLSDSKEMSLLREAVEENNCILISYPYLN